MHLEFDQMSGGVPSHYTRKKIYMAGSDAELDYINTAPSGTTPTWQQDTVRVYIPAPDGTAGAAEFTSTSTLNSPTPDRALVYHTDHLGSIESITPWGDTTTTLATSESGQSSRYSYDPWGERRNPGTWNGTPTTTDSGGPDGTTPRGYTGHEMMDGLGLVHMNGRIYDPLIGRMLSADVVVQYPNPAEPEPRRV
jgi:RHS repeat-associated protein